MSIPSFDPAAGPPAYLYEKVADHIALRIELGDLPPGARLPDERSLARQYRVSVGTARSATQRLRQRELVVTLPGKGTFVLPAVDGLSRGNS